MSADLFPPADVMMFCSVEHLVKWYKYKENNVTTNRNTCPRFHSPSFCLTLGMVGCSSTSPEQNIYVFE